MWKAMFLAAWTIACCVQPLGAVKVQEDLAASLPEESWYDASQHKSELDAWMGAYQGIRDLTCLDVFSLSGSMAKTWSDSGYSAVQFDIGLDRRGHDLLGKRGFLHLVRCGLRLVQGSMVVLGPPCAMNVFLSTSVHKRHLYGPMGDVGNKKVRMSNLLVSNMCTFLELLARHRAYWCLIEQPSSSWLFKMNMMLALSALLSFVKVTTSMGMFGHDLVKPSHLVGNLPALSDLRRKVTKADRRRIQKRLERRQRNRKAPRKYFVKGTEIKDGKVKKTVTGCKDLQKSAAYTPQFAQAVFQLWLAAFGNQ